MNEMGDTEWRGREREIDRDLPCLPPCHHFGPPIPVLPLLPFHSFPSLLSFPSFPSFCFLHFFSSLIPAAIDSPPPPTSLSPAGWTHRYKWLCFGWELLYFRSRNRAPGPEIVYLGGLSGLSYRKAHWKGWGGAKLPTFSSRFCGRRGLFRSNK